MTLWSLLLAAVLQTEAVPLPHVVERDGLRLSADVALPLERLADQVVRDVARLEASFSAFPVARNLPALEHLYFLADAASVDPLLEAHGAAPTAWAGRARTDVGIGAIFVVGDARRDHRRILAHELAHAVLAPKTRTRGTFVEEGLAEVLSDWLVFGGGGRFGDVRIDSLTRMRDAARALREHRPKLASLVRLTDEEFHRADRRDDHYDLAWSFVHFLLTTDDPALAGRFGKFIGTLARGKPRDAEDDWRRLAEVVDRKKLERAWRRAALEGPADWAPRTASWFAVEDRLAMFMSGTGSGILLRDDGRTTPRATLRFGLATTLPESGLQAGVVFGHRGPDDYVIGALDRGATRFGLLRREGGNFGRWETFSLPPGAPEFEVRVDRGEVRLLRGDDELARHAFAPAALRGNVGLWAERSFGPEEPWVPGEVVFRDVRITR